MKKQKCKILGWAGARSGAELGSPRRRVRAFFLDDLLAKRRLESDPSADILIAHLVSFERLLENAKPAIKVARQNGREFLMRLRYEGPAPA